MNGDDKSGDVAVADLLNLEEEVEIINQGIQQLRNIPAYPEVRKINQKSKFEFFKDDFFTGWVPSMAMSENGHQQQL
jgi:hypothetical protein